MKLKLIRYLSLVITLVMLLPVLFVTASATTVTPIAGCITVTDTQNNVKLSQGTVTAKASGGLLSQKTNTLTIKNSGSGKAKISFTYSASNYGSFSESSASGNKEATLEAGGTITMSIKGKTGLSGTTATLTLSNFTYTAIGEAVTATLACTDSLGSVTSGGTAITNGKTFEIPSEGVTMAASAKSGAEFVGWMNPDNNSMLSTDASFTLLPVSGLTTVQAVFETKGTGAAWYLAGGDKMYSDFAKATAYAASATTKTVVLLNNGTMATGTLEIPSGVTFVVPYAKKQYTVDSKTATNGMNSTLEHANKALVKAAENTDSSRFITSSPYLELTIPSKTTLDINGIMSIGGTLVANSGVYPCNVPNGAHSNVNLKGTLNVNDKGILSVCGYLLGDGQLNVYDGGTVYQPYSLLDNRGAGYTIHAASGDNSYKAGSVSGHEDWLAPFHQFVIQNIQTDTRIYYGGTLKCYAVLFTNSLLTTPDQHNASIGVAIGTAGSGSLLELAEGAYADISYDGTAVSTAPASQRVGTQTIKVYGGAALGSFSLTVNFMGERTVSSDMYAYSLPFNYNIELLAAEGTTPTYAIPYSMSLLPGSRIYVGKNATLNIGGASASRFTVYEGLYDHVVCSATSTSYGKPDAKVAYPNPSQLSVASRKTAALVVDGTLVLGNNLTFGGLIQTKGTGTVQVGSGTTLNITTQYGIVCAPSIMGGLKTWNFSGATVHNLTARVMNAKGTSINLANGVTYYGVDSTKRTLKDYSYTLYTANNFTTSVPRTDTLNAEVSGSWCTAKGHNFDSGAVTAPTCTEDGYTTYTCQEASCGYSYQANPVPALGHSADTGKITTPAKCETTGVKTFTCLVCGETARTEVIPVTGHNYSITGYTTHDNDSCIANKTCKNDSSHTKSDEPAAHAYDANFKCGKCEWIKQFTITFNTNGGSAIKAITQAYNSEVTVPADPTKEGHTFTGWVPTVPPTMPGKDLEITASWKINQYTITFNTAGGTEIAPITQNFGTDVTKPADPTKKGYTFKGWNPEIPATIPDKDLAVTAQWDPIQYTITFDSNGGSAVNPIKQGYETKITAPANPTKKGYTFKGWSPALPATMPLNGGTYTATWAINQYTITFDTQGGSAIPAITQDYNTAVTAPENPTKTGYTFTKWDKTIPTVMPPENMTITAVWAANSYQIKWETDSGNFATTNAKYGSTIALPGAPSKTGYTFDGWWTEKTGGNRITDTTVYMTDGPSTYYAHWKINQYTISFLDTDGSVLHTIKQDYGTSVTAPKNPTKTGYTFTGWSAEIPTTMPAENVTIKAKWTINQYTITFNTDGGPEIAPITQNYGTAIPPITDPVKSGYTFSGWSQEIPATMPAENITIKAMWNVNTYEVTWNVDGEIFCTTQQTYDSNLVLPKAPTKDGHTFLGWFTSETGGEQVTEATVYTTAGETTYHAQWKVNEYTVTWYVNEEIVETDTVTYETVPSYDGASPIKAKDNCIEYTFAGWSVTRNGPALKEEDLPAVEQNIEYFAVFTATTTHHKSTEWSHNETHHWHGCANCNAYIRYDYAQHEFSEDGKCVCGFQKLIDLFKIYATNIKAGDSLDMNFYVQKKDVAELSNCVAIITKTYADGRYFEPITIPQGQWTPYGSDLLRFGFSDISAKEMTDEVYVIIKDSEGNQISATYYESVESYALRALALYTDAPSGSKNEKLRTALVDMLYYGAAAQTYFGYGMDDLATSEIGEYAKYASSGVLDVKDIAKNKEPGKYNNFECDNLVAENSITYNFYFSGITKETKAYISYTTHGGTVYERKKVDSAEFVSTNYGNIPVLGVPVKGLAIADGSQVITCVVEDANGNTVANAQGSIESYVARNLYNGNGPLVVPLMRFVDSAYAYFHHGEQTN